MMALLQERYCEWPATQKLVLLLTIGSSQVLLKQLMIYNLLKHSLWCHNFSCNEQRKHAMIYDSEAESFLLMSQFFEC